jgi:hypothetical protein
MANTSIKAGMFNLNSDALFGTGPGGDTGAPIWKSSVYIPTVGNVIAEIAALRAAGMTVFANLADSRNQWTDLNASGQRIFNMTKYETQMRRWTVAGGASQAVADAVALAIADKVFLVYTIDEPNIPLFGGSIPKSVQNDLGLLAKTIWPGAITCMRSSFANMNPPPTGGWTGIDYGWSQAEGPLHVPSNGKTIAQFFASEQAGFATIDVGFIPGFNWQDGGDGRLWNCTNANPAASCRITGLAGTSSRWLASPDELKAAADAAYQLNAPAFVFWTYVYSQFQPQQPWLTYQQRADYIAAFDYAINKFNSATPFTGLRSAKGVAASPGTGGGAPAWTFQGIAAKVTAVNAASVQVPIPQGVIAVGDLLVMQVYSNDGTARSPDLPTGWALAQRVDGTSVTGGHMVAFKVATSTEAVGGLGEGKEYVTVSFTGAGVAGIAQMGRMAVFRGNNTTQASVLGAVGPDSTWASKENLGVITGFTALDDDALVLVFGARKDDFGATASGSYYQFVPLTGDLTWAEMWHSEALGTSIGQDAMMLANYGIISGAAVAIADKTFALNSGATAQPAFQASGTQVSGAGAVSPPWPVSHAVNDVALLMVESQGGEAVTLSDPQGFQEITALTLGEGTGAGSTRLTVFWHRATSTAMATPTVADPGDHVIARISTFRNVVSVGVPWDVLKVSSLAVAATAVSIPGDTTYSPNDLVVMIVTNGIDSAASQLDTPVNADLGSVTKRSDSNTNTGTGGGFCFSHGTLVTAGAFGATTANLLASSKQVLATIALKPALAAGPGNGFMVSFKRAAFTAPAGGSQIPVLTAISPISVNKGSLVSFSASATGGSITYSADTPPVGPVINSSTGAFTWTPDIAGVYNITIRAANGLGSDAKVVQITVHEVSPFTPVLTGIGDRQVVAGNTLTFTATATNPNAGVLQYSISADAPAGASIDANSGVFVWATTIDDVGDHAFTVTVDDGAATTFENIVVSVAVVNPAQTYAVFAQEDLTTIRLAVALALNIRQLNSAAEEHLEDLLNTIDQALDYVADVVTTGQVPPR